MRVIMIAAVLAVGLALPGLAAAQAGRLGGHRQPTAKDAGREPTTPPMTTTKQDRALDRALKGICRGC